MILCTPICSRFRCPVRQTVRFTALSCALALAWLAPGAVAQCTSPPPPMTSWLPLDADAADLFGSNDGSLDGTPSFVPGHVGGAISFDGDDDGVTIPHDPSLDVQATGFTVEFWMRGRPTQPHGQYLVVDKSHGWADSTGWLFQGFAGSGQLDFGIGAGGPGSANFPIVRSAAGVIDDAYHHVAGTWDGSQIELFVDGVSQGTAGLATPTNNERPVQIGASWGGGARTRFFRGEVDELTIYPRALTADEIAAIATADRAGKCRPAASCAFRNGTGVNATGFVCTTNPVLGTDWTSRVPTAPATVTTVLAIAGLPATVPFLGGELLFDPTGAAVFVLGNGDYTVPIPHAISFLGVPLATQGVRVDAPGGPGGQPSLILFNAQDIVLGF